MTTENNNILEETLQQVRASGILFVYKVKIKMITSDMLFFTDYYLPSNSKMANFHEKDAQYVFRILLDHFFKYFTEILSVDEISNVEVVRIENDVIITSKNWAVGH